jgi:hypothetical protein
MALKKKTHDIEKASTVQQAPQQQETARAANEHPRPSNAAIALQRAAGPRPSALKPADILALQRTVGNRAVGRILAGNAPQPPASRMQNGQALQAKLVVGAANDQSEQEADRVASQVLSRSAVSTTASRSIQRRVDSGTGAVAVPPAIEDDIQRVRGGGQTLPDDLRARMEPAFGADFSGVRVHTDAKAHALNQSLAARAFTTGQDIFFRGGEYNPGSQTGQELLAHELTHVIQQMPASRGLIQTMKWPDRKKRPALVSQLQEHWTDATEETTQSFYTWCSAKDDFDLLPTKMTQGAVEAEMAKHPNSATFRSQNGITNESTLNEYLLSLSKPTPVVAYNTYPDSNYTGASEMLKKEVSELGITFEQVEGISKGLQGELMLADKARVAARWEKENNTGLLLPKRQELNEKIKEAEEKIEQLINQVGKEKAEKEEKERAAAEKQLAIQASRALAQALPQFTAVNANPLASLVWTASVNAAGKPGFVEVNKTIYTEATVTAATALLIKFSKAWTRKYGETKFLTNPHCPGGGKVQDKSGGEHSSLDARTSLYQADFIATWGADTMVVHINADKASTS